MRVERRRPCRLLFLLLFAVACSSPPASELRPGKPVDLELATGESRTLTVNLEAGQRVEIVAQQLGVDAGLRWLSPAAVEIASEDRVGRRGGFETIFAMTDEAGVYSLEVFRQDEGPAGLVSVELEAVDPPRPADRDAGRGLFHRGDELLGESAEESKLEAIAVLERALESWETLGDARWQARTWALLQTARVTQGLFGDAAAACDEAVEAAEPGGDRQALAFLHLRCGWAQDEEGLSEEAAASYAAAVNLFDELGNRLTLAEARQEFGVFLSRLGRQEEAIGVQQAALEIFEEYGAEKAQATVLTSIGLGYEETGKPELALEYYARALPLRRATGHDLGEVVTLNNIAKAHFSMGDQQRAIEHYGQAILKLESMDRPFVRATLVNNLGAAYRRLGDYDRALALYAEALEIRQDGGSPISVAGTTSNIGVVYQRQKRFREAIEQFRAAIELFRKGAYQSGLAAALENLGDVQLELARAAETSADRQRFIQAARDAFVEARDICAETSNPRGLAGNLIGLARVSLAQGDLEEAREILGRALEAARQASDRSAEAEALGVLARVEVESARFAEARAAIEAAVAIVERQRRSLTALNLRSSFLESQLPLFGLHVDVLMSLHEGQRGAGFDRLALTAKERFKARVLTELLAEVGADLRGDFDPELLEEERMLLAQIGGREQFRRRKKDRGETLPEGLEEEIGTLVRDLDDVQARMRAESPRYAALVWPEPLSVRDLQESLDDRTLLLEFSLSAKSAYLWAVSRTGFESFRLGESESLKRAARELQALLLTARRDAASRRPAEVAAVELAVRLLGDVAGTGLLEAFERILVIPDGALFYVPFAALPIPGGAGPDDREPVLLGDKEVTYSFSASAPRLRREVLAGRSPAAKTIAVLADPVYEGSDSRLGSTRPSRVDPVTSRSAGPGLGRLPFSRTEAQEIASLVEPGERLLALDFDATRELVRSPEIGGFRILHLAAHGEIDDSKPERSAVVFSLFDPSGEPVDGHLTLLDTYGLELSADLVVLSACDTALGRELGGEGLLGLTQGFMFAGARSVMSSLWAVDDEATAELVRWFYRALLGDGLSPAAALRSAQKQLRSMPEFDHPVYWAGFGLYGDWGGVEPADS